ncbi:MAG: FHA domain-containing protein [Deltaproteobacteria bacterium]|nr:FHA domain-containing protein [Deltaproteobacteria bacterium]
MDKKQRKFRLKLLFQEFDLTPGGFSIGRSPSCNLTLEDPLVSRQHARISIFDNHATIDDLGSRNGTLVNGEPVFDDHRLTHSDQIRIGSHDLVFIEVRRFSPMMQTLSDTTVACPGCGAPFPSDEAQCPTCGSLLVPDNVCLNCRTPTTADALYCSKCGAPLRRDDSTIPVELGGDAAGWTSQLINEVIEKALSVERYEQAARLVDGKTREFDKKPTQNAIDLDTLVELCGFNLDVARGLRDSKRLLWGLRHFSKHAEPMPESLLEHLEKAATGWYDIGADLQGYLKALESSSKEETPESSSVMKLLKDMIDRTR